jgi:RND family efflux transporter MFP subunit
MILVSLLALSGCERQAPEAEAAVAAPVAITTAPVQLARYRPHTEITGSAEPIASVQLGFDVPGRIRELHVQRGDVVEVGQALAVLDGAVAYGQHNQAKAGVAAAEAAAVAAEDAWQRVQKLGDLATPQQLTQVEAQMKAAKAQVEQARAAEKVASTSLYLHTLRAPIAGVVTNAPDNPGTMTGAGTPLFVIEDLTALRIKGSAPEVESWLAPGQTATVRTGAGEEKVAGVVERVLPSLDPATRRIPVEIRVDDPPPWLRAHAFVRADVAASADIDVYAVPRRSVVARPEFAVLVVPSPGADPVRVPVTVVGEEDERTLVRGELSAGDLVAVDPPQSWGT